MNSEAHRRQLSEEEELNRTLAQKRAAEQAAQEDALSMSQVCAHMSIHASCSYGALAAILPNS